MHQAFLRAICEEPDDDTPRLVYADWLEENGEGERAEFVRVQVALHRHAGLGGFRTGPYSWDGATVKGCVCPACVRLRIREGELLTGPDEPSYCYQWLAGLPGEDRSSNGGGNEVARKLPCGARIVYTYRRGFPEAVACLLEVWLKHGPQVVALAPVVEVRATDVRAHRYHNNSPPSPPWFAWHRGHNAPTGTGDCGVPDWLWRLVIKEPGCKRHGPWADFRTEAEAAGALSNVLVDWARAEAELPALRREKATA